LNKRIWVEKLKTKSITLHAYGHNSGGVITKLLSLVIKRLSKHPTKKERLCKAQVSHKAILSLSPELTAQACYVINVDFYFTRKLLIHMLLLVNNYYDWHNNYSQHQDQKG